MTGRAMQRLIIPTVLCVGSLAAPAAGETIVIEATGIVPQTLTVMTGQRVHFENHTQQVVHVEFGDDPHQHEVIQIPVTGPIWAIFHRPGTHPYVVHVYDGGRTRTLSGLVDVKTDETHRWDSQTCGLIIMSECIER